MERKQGWSTRAPSPWEWGVPMRATARGADEKVGARFQIAA